MRHPSALVREYQRFAKYFEEAKKLTRPERKIVLANLPNFKDENVKRALKNSVDKGLEQLKSVITKLGLK